MDSKKQINVGISSSLIDLKAELLRKQAELRSTRSRDSRGGAVKSAKKSDILRAKSKDARSNKGIEVRSQKDRLRIAEEEKSLEKSRNVLEAKAQLYDKMQKAALILDNVDDDHDDSAVNPLFANSLVNFQQKAVDEIEERRRNLELERKRKLEKVEEEEDDALPGPYPVDEEEWTEFTDALGRTRKCLKTDISSYLERDEKLSRPENPGISLSAAADDRMREMKRERWEIEAELLEAKDKVHYQDILFDEVRTHGAGYYAFSKDEATRAQQMKDLKKLSEQTASSRQKIKKDKSEKKSALKERLKKIRNKKRAKQGLPPLPDSSEEEEDEDEPENADAKEETLEEKDGKQPSEIRAWDVGKAGVFGPRPTTFDELDEKWLKDRRSDRIPEFAPPTSIYSEGGLRKQYNSQKQASTAFSAFSAFDRDKYQNFVKSEDPLPSTSTTANIPPPPVVVEEPQPKPFRPPDNFWKQRGTSSSSRPPPQKPVPIEDEMPAPIPESSEEFDRGRGTEIAPPPTFEYYHGESRPKPQRGPPGQSDAYVKDAVSTGLKALREQFESKKRGSGSTSTEKQFPDFL